MAVLIPDERWVVLRHKNFKTQQANIRDKQDQATANVAPIDVGSIPGHSIRWLEKILAAPSVDKHGKCAKTEKIN